MAVSESVAIANDVGVGVDKGDRGVTIAEAAAILGISTNAVKLRLQRGTLTALRGNGRVRVLLTETRDEEATPTPTPISQRYQHPNQHQHRPTPELRQDDAALAAARALLAEVSHQRDHLEAEVAKLNARLDAEAVERAELRRLLGNAQQTVQMLTSGDGDGVEDRQEQAADQFPYRDTSDAHGGVQRESAVSEKRRTWWERLFGL